MTSEHQQAVSGVKWLSVSQATQLTTQFLGVIVLARLLPPSDYGLLSMAVIVTGFVGLFSDLGTAAGIIQRPDLSHRLINSLFWLNVTLGAVLFVIVGVLAPFVAWGFGEPRLKYVLWALMLTFPIASLGSVHRALLERSSRFRPVAIIESVAAVMALAAAVWAAIAGWGVFSLVLQPLLSASLTAACLWMASQWRPALNWDFDEIRSMVKFSGNLVGFKVFNYFCRNADSLLIGFFIGSAGLGIYSMAYRIMLFPLSNISWVISRALYPSFSRLQSNHQQMGAMFIQITGAIIFITAPMMVGVFVLREPFVQLVLGDRWSQVSDLLFWLAPIGLLQSVETSLGLIFMSTGRTDVLFKWEVFTGSLIVLAFLLGLPWGIDGVAIAYFIISFLEGLPTFMVAFSLIGLKLTVFLRAISLPILLSVVMGIVVYCAKTYLPMGNESLGVQFVLLVLLGAATYMALSLSFQRKMLTSICIALVNR
jgi:O-antigen/teichoic acid export membrane protein